MVKQLLRAPRIPEHVQPVGRPCGTPMHYAMRDVKDMDQPMGYRSLEWNWPKEAMNIPIGAGIVDGAKLFKPFNNNNKRPLTPKSMPPAGDEHAKLKT